MLKQIAFSLALGLGTLSLTPSTGLAWGHHYRPHYYHHYHGGDAWAWGLTGLVLGGALIWWVEQQPARPAPIPSRAKAEGPP